MARYVATRSLHYVDTKGDERFVGKGDYATNLSDAQVEEMLADGFIREAKKE